jgi:hypothetical protein
MDNLRDYLDGKYFKNEEILPANEIYDKYLLSFQDYQFYKVWFKPVQKYNLRGMEMKAKKEVKVVKTKSKPKKVKEEVKAAKTKEKKMKDENYEIGDGYGDNFDDYMKEMGTKYYEAVKRITMKKLLVFQFKQEMRAKRLTVEIIAIRMRTSKGAVEHILDPNHNSTLNSLCRFASVLGKEIVMTLK